MWRVLGGVSEGDEDRDQGTDEDEDEDMKKKISKTLKRKNMTLFHSLSMILFV